MRDFWEKGYAVYPSLFSRHECSMIRMEAATLRTTEQVMQPHRILPSVEATARDERLVSIMEYLCAGEVDLVQTQLFFNPPGTKGFTVHQDNFYVQADPGAFASAWLSLENVNQLNGCLYAHDAEEVILPVIEYPDAPPHRRVEVVMPSGNAKLVPTVTGDVIFIHPLVPHGSLDNTSANRTRMALLLTYIRKGASFNPGTHACRERFDVYS